LRHKNGAPAIRWRVYYTRTMDYKG
jgi:hypothetical protein